MEAWQSRVLEERKELEEKIANLSAFLDKGAPLASVEDKMLLTMQLNAMRSYAGILDFRVLRFSWNQVAA